MQYEADRFDCPSLLIQWVVRAAYYLTVIQRGFSCALTIKVGYHRSFFQKNLVWGNRITKKYTICLCDVFLLVGTLLIEYAPDLTQIIATLFVSKSRCNAVRRGRSFQLPRLINSVSSYSWMLHDCYSVRLFMCPNFKSWLSQIIFSK